MGDRLVFMTVEIVTFNNVKGSTIVVRDVQYYFIVSDRQSPY